MACLYRPYRRRRMAEGGFCEPVRILLTVLRAWLNTRSGLVSRCTRRQKKKKRVSRGNTPTESAMARVKRAPPHEGSVAWIAGAADKGASRSTRANQQTRRRRASTRARQWMRMVTMAMITGGEHDDAMACDQGVPWLSLRCRRRRRLGLGCAGPATTTLAMWHGQPLSFLLSCFSSSPCPRLMPFCCLAWLYPILTARHVLVEAYTSVAVAGPPAFMLSASPADLYLYHVRHSGTPAALCPPAVSGLLINPV